MADQSRLNYGMEKLNKALDALEASINEFGNNQKSDRAKIVGVDLLKKQNAELTEELTSLKARTNVLEEANNEVMERLGAAAENISDVLRAV